MKKVLKLLVCLILMIPIFIKAYTLSNYSGSINYTNSYINRYADKNKYLLFGQKYDFAGGKAVQNNDYKSGGLLSFDEYNASKGEYSSYLATGRGRDYWTLTSNGTNNQYYIENGILSKNKDLQSGIRVTQYVQPGVNVDGMGTYNNPWMFREQFSVTINVENSNHGYATPSFKMVDPNTKFKFTITDKPGYEYKRSDCALTKRASSNEYETKPIKEDTICTLSFDKRFITITYACTLGTGNVPSQVVEYGTDYSIADYTCERTGYHQTAWKTSGGNEWTKGAQGKFEVENGVRGLVKNKLDLQPLWVANELVFDAQTLNAGNYATAYTSNAFTGASNGTGSYTYTIKSGAPSGATIDSTNRTISFTNTTAAGTYNVVVHAKDNNSGSEKDATMTIKINKIDSVITCSNPTYTGSSQTIATCSGGTISNNTRTAAGSQTVTCTGDANHNTVTKSCSVAKANASITCTNPTYTGSSQTIASCSGGTPSNHTRKDAGSQTVTCTGDANHNTVTKSCSVAKANASITCTNPTYTGSSQTIASCSGGTPSNHTRTAAGSQTVTCTGDANHNTVTKSCSIAKANASITCTNPTYTGSSLTIASCSGGTPSGHTRTNAGSQTVTCTGDANHNTVTKSCSVAKANQSAPTVTAYKGRYDGKSHCATVSGGTSGKEFSYAKWTKNGYDSWSNWSTQTSNICATAVAYWKIRVRSAATTNYNVSPATESYVWVQETKDTVCASWYQLFAYSCAENPAPYNYRSDNYSVGYGTCSNMEGQSWGAVYWHPIYCGNPELCAKYGYTAGSTLMTTIKAEYGCTGEWYGQWCTCPGH